MIMMIIKRIPEGGLIPRGYGIAWWEDIHMRAVLLPMPLNVVVGWARQGLIWLKCYAYPQPTWDRQSTFIDGYNYFKTRALAELDKQPPPLPPPYMTGYYFK